MKQHETQLQAGVTALRATGVTKVYHHRGSTRVILDELDFSVVPGELVAVVGRSGTGKSTLLNILGALDQPDSGTVEIAGQRCDNLSPAQVAKVRAQSVGFVFQAMNLIQHLSVATNIEAGTWPADPSLRRERMAELLDGVGLSDLSGRRAAELSLGEQQRVAVVRALVKRPAVVLADEPTGSLDAENEAAVMHVLRRAAEEGSGVVVVTHSDSVAALADRRCQLLDGAFTVSEV